MLFKRDINNVDKTGNVLDFDIIYEKYHQAIYANIYRLVKSPSLSEDILQEVFIAFWENKDKLNVDTIDNWLFVVSYHKALSQLKKALRSSFIAIMSPDQILNIVPFRCDNSVARDDYELRSTILEEAINQLSLKKQEVFRLCKLEGLSYKETASQLGISTETVKSYLKQSIKLIKSHIADCSQDNILLNK